jgi:hypothetical protein
MIISEIDFKGSIVEYQYTCEACHRQLVGKQPFVHRRVEPHQDLILVCDDCWQENVEVFEAAMRNIAIKVAETDPQ